jgi:hypothetical protein
LLPLLVGELLACSRELADHDSFDVLVNNRNTPCESEFLDESEGDGSVYTVPLPNGESARIIVLVGAKGASSARLEYGGKTVQTVEEMAGPDATAAADPAVIIAKGVKSS